MKKPLDPEPAPKHKYKRARVDDDDQESSVDDSDNAPAHDHDDDLEVPEYTQAYVQSLVTIGQNPNLNSAQRRELADRDVIQYIENAWSQVSEAVKNEMHVAAEYMVDLMCRAPRGRSDYKRVADLPGNKKPLPDLEFEESRWASRSCPAVLLQSGDDGIQWWWKWWGHLLSDNPNLRAAVAQGASDPTAPYVDVTQVWIHWDEQRGPGIYGTGVVVTLPDGTQVLRFYIGEGLRIEIRLVDHLGPFHDSRGGSGSGNKVNASVAQTYRDVPDEDQHHGYVLTLFPRTMPDPLRFATESMLIRITGAVDPEHGGVNVRSRDAAHGGEALHGHGKKRSSTWLATHSAFLDDVTVVSIYCAGLHHLRGRPIPAGEDPWWNTLGDFREIGGNPVGSVRVAGICMGLTYPRLTGHLPDIVPYQARKGPTTDAWRRQSQPAAGAKKNGDKTARARSTRTLRKEEAEAKENGDAPAGQRALHTGKRRAARPTYETRVLAALKEEAGTTSKYVC